MALTESNRDIVPGAVPGASGMSEELVRLPPLDRWRLEASLNQRGRFQGGSRSLSLFNGHFLEVREAHRGRHRRAVLNLAFLEAGPVAHQKIAWRWLATTAVVLVAGLATMWRDLLLPGSGLLALGVLTGLQGLRRSGWQLVFYTHLGRVPAFVLEPGWLSRGEAERFADVLSERIQGAHWLLPQGRERLAAVMAEHRRLHDSGCVTTRQYERARQRIMSCFSHG